MAYHSFFSLDKGRFHLQQQQWESLVSYPTVIHLRLDIVSKGAIFSINSGISHVRMKKEERNTWRSSLLGNTSTCEPWRRAAFICTNNELSIRGERLYPLYGWIVDPGVKWQPALSPTIVWTAQCSKDQPYFSCYLASWRSSEKPPKTLHGRWNGVRPICSKIGYFCATTCSNWGLNRSRHC